jgi:hypothetical protein
MGVCRLLLVFLALTSAMLERDIGKHDLFVFC